MEQYRLINEYKDYDEDSLCDYLLIIAGNVEDSLMAAGAVPKIDYTYLDIYKLAVELIKMERIHGKITNDD